MDESHTAASLEAQYFTVQQYQHYFYSYRADYEDQISISHKTKVSFLHFDLGGTEKQQKHHHLSHHLEIFLSNTAD